APVDMGAAYGQYFRGFQHASDMTFVIPAAQALGCATELRMRGGDSAGRNNRAVWPNVRCIPDRIFGQKKNKSGYCLFFRYLTPLAK
ncbi:hypothetical protein, partial [Mesorhizobium sp. M7A.F.Ca.MR.245.00.0.0]|uniref:hypothetical protein n=1 Tax=Mesorhizobium sp. M7A.F.Ca.MR.245.00.0.0 TaxID=2496778 RepID=UPI0019D25E5B